ncbi:plasma serine protease inhibitor-like [Trichomycterus rosablanca]|uniref:plasma serine protease inhibitor-like n=1 Tax=Trichomycterus rosablanca TaxID=2290929 RepID=UPI002F3519A7
MGRNVLGLWFCLSLAFISTCVHGDLEPQPDTQALNRMNSDFSFRLYKSIASGARSENVFFSPLSVSMALAALSLGAGGETHHQLLSGLGLNSSVFTCEEMHQSFLDLLKNLNQNTEVNLEVGTAVYIHESFKPHPEFLQKMKRFYLSDGFSVDFTKTTETADQMNAYVSEKTHGKISNFIKDLDPRTIMYLLSYIYFKGKWATQFDPKMTKKDVFHVDEETNVPVEMMYMKDKFQGYYDRELSAHALRLDYKDSFSMILVLPDKNLTAVEEALSLHHITRWNTWMQKREYNIYVPKLSLKTSYSLKNILIEMGMKDMFTPKANLTGISDQNLFISEAVHEATLDVDEAGATAAAVTGISFMPLSFHFTETLKFNRPFIIFITDQITKNILFMGKIVNPEYSAA